MSEASSWADFEPRYMKLETRPLAPENVETWLFDWSELEKEVEEQLAHIFRTKYADTTDRAADEAYTAFYRDVVPPTRHASQRLTKKFLALEGYMPEADNIQLLKRFRNEAELYREENVRLLSEEATLGTHFSTLNGRLKVVIEGKAHTKTEARRLLLTSERAVREQAYRAIKDAQLSVSSELDELALKLLTLRRRIARNAGFENFLDYKWRGLGRFDYTPEDARTFHRTVELEALPLRLKLLEERKAAFGLDVLQPWDMEVDTASSKPLKPFETTDELIAGMQRMVTQLDPRLGTLFSAIELDLEGRPGKVSGIGYQLYFPKSQEAFVYNTSNGTHDNVVVLAHEVGHAFHALLSGERRDLNWNRRPGTEFCEVASQTMELLMLPYLERSEGGFYNPEDASRARREGLENILADFPNRALIDAFQHWLYADAPDDVSVADIDAKWLELSDRFAPGIDWRGIEDVRKKGWQIFPIFVMPFYIIEYTLAWLGAIQIWQSSLTDPKGALTKYRDALALGGTRPLPELFEVAGAKFAFDRETVGELLRFVYAQR